MQCFTPLQGSCLFTCQLLALVSRFYANPQLYKLFVSKLFDTIIIRFDFAWNPETDIRTSLQKPTEIGVQPLRYLGPLHPTVVQGSLLTEPYNVKVYNYLSSIDRIIQNWEVNKLFSRVTMHSHIQKTGNFRRQYTSPLT